MNDKLELKGVEDERINISFDKSQDPLTLDFLESIKESGPSSQSQQNDNLSCPKTLLDFPALIEGIKNVVTHTNKTRGVKIECIEASLQRAIPNTGYVCDGDKKESFTNTGKKAPCLKQKVVNFLHHSLNKAINCVSTGREPIDPRFILKKINSETAFNFFVAYNGGVGLGQLTSIPVKEIAGWYEGRHIATGNGESILGDVINSSNPACAPFSKIIQNDLLYPPPPPGSPKNYCLWVSPGQGVARNLIYLLMYYTYVRDEIIRPAVEERSWILSKNNDIINYLTLVAYGPGGSAEAKSLIQELRLNAKSDPEKVKSFIIRNNEYVKQTELKMNELLKNLKQASPTAYDNASEDDHRSGNTCLEPE